MNDHFLRNYAKVILRIGVNLQEGQNLYISAEPIHWDFITYLVEEAYQLGAQFVKVDAHHPAAFKARISYARDAYLGYVPTNFTVEQQTMMDESWAVVSLDGMEDPHVYDNMDQDRNSVVQKATRKARLPFSKAMITGQCPWVIAAVPTEKWAAEILETTPSPAAVDQMWEIMKPILHLDQPDPVKSWEAQSAALKRRARILTENRLSYVRFEGPETELKISLSSQARWVGGLFKATAGYEFLPNLPTYEVFTTPDYRFTEGRAKVTRPVKVFGSDVENAWFVFKDGAVVDFGADKGATNLEKYLAIDDQSKYLGEVALVDINSPIYQSQRTFHSILYDENAACHIALGRGLPITFDNGDQLSEKELAEMGCNLSIQHTDFMIGSPEISVFGGKSDNSEMAIIKKGEFVI